MAENAGIPVSAGAHADNVRELQQYLREISQSGAEVRSVIPDGVYSERTAGAVSDYQRMKDIPVTGETDRATWDSVYRTHMELTASEAGIYAFPSPDAELAAGDSGAAILILQAMLGVIGGEYFNVGTNSFSGCYDSDTEYSVMVIQAAAGIPITGRTDLKTWNAIVNIFNSTRIAFAAG